MEYSPGKDEVVVTSKQCFLLGGALILLGTLFYLLYRPNPPVLIQPFDSLLPDYQFGKNLILYRSFPSFVYVAGFSFLTMAFLFQNKKSILSIGIFWLLVNISYELSCLSPLIKNLFAAVSPAHYSCTFDSGDIIASFCGALLFFIVMSLLNKLYK